jgi:hypothetical protein
MNIHDVTSAWFRTEIITRAALEGGGGGGADKRLIRRAVCNVINIESSSVSFWF